jgi:hypothetical protein
MEREGFEEGECGVVGEDEREAAGCGSGVVSGG